MDKDLEKQLEDLQKNFLGLAKTMAKSSKAILEGTNQDKKQSQIKKLLNKTMGDYHKRVKEGDGIFHEFGDAVEAAQKDVKNFGSKLKGMPSPLGLFAKAVTFVAKAVVTTGTALLKTALALSDVTQKFEGLEDVIDAGIADISVLGPAVKGLASDVDANVSVFRQLAQTGASFGSSIVALRKAQADAEMPLSKFTDLVASNSVTLAKLFGTVDQGVPQIAGFMKSLRGMTMSEFAKFGLTLDETSEFLGTFLELERARGNMTQMTQGELLNATRTYTKDLVTLSKLTGKSVDELNKQNLAMAADGVLQSQLAGMNVEDAKKLSLGLSELPPGLQQLGKEIIGLGSPISDTSQDLEAISGGRLGDAFRQFQDTGDLVEFQNSIKTISQDVMQNSEAFGKATLAGGRFGTALNEFALKAGKAVDPEKVQGQLTAAGDNIAEVLNVTTGEVDKVKAALETFRFNAVKPLIFEGENAAAGLKKLREVIQENFLDQKEEISKMVERVSKFIMGESGGDDFDGNKITTQEKHDDLLTNKGFIGNGNNMGEGGASFGTRGFRDFGRGTPMVLHGSEMVLPERNVGELAEQLASAIAGLASDNTNLITGGAPITGGEQMAAATAGMGNTELANIQNNMANLLEVTKKVEQHLNTSVTIGAMTEKNTKETKNTLAGMGAIV